ncbi:ribosome biogenesis GTPase YqeH [Spiroplasma endosymbiont of Anurida maritima]|uniref:ribosome biogenesis GTPase YqeH n=1 Tax=Spiroplasma endosymbiont of Anurida maritima TaxID=2967972 RepID=UPI0036D24AFC
MEVNNNINNLNCTGCGALLQNNNIEEKGYIANLEHENCLRCFKIKNYNEITDYNIDNEDFKHKMHDIHNEKNVYFYVIDAFDILGSRNKFLEELIQNNHVYIVINKYDLVMKLISQTEILKYFDNLFGKSELKNFEFIFTSSLKNYNIDNLVKKIKNVKSDAYFIGASNVGKSSLLNAVLKSLMLHKNVKITVSNYLATTLDFIKINIGTNYNIFDCPGIINDNSAINYVGKDTYKQIINNKLVRPVTYQLNPNQSVFMEGLCMLLFENDHMKKTDKRNFHFYKNNKWNLHRTKSINWKKYFMNNVEKNIDVKFESYKNMQESIFPIVKDKWYSLFIAGCGWVTFKGQKNDHIAIWTNENVEVQLTERYI